jgi:hypothetical protein
MLTFLNSAVKHTVGLRPAMFGFLRISSKANNIGLRDFSAVTHLN